MIRFSTRHAVSRWTDTLCDRRRPSQATCPAEGAGAGAMSEWSVERMVRSEGHVFAYERTDGSTLLFWQRQKRANQWMNENDMKKVCAQCLIYDSLTMMYLRHVWQYDICIYIFIITASYSGCQIVLNLELKNVCVATFFFCFNSHVVIPSHITLFSLTALTDWLTDRRARPTDCGSTISSRLWLHSFISYKRYVSLS